MGLNNFKCNHLTPLRFKGLTVVFAVSEEIDLERLLQSSSKIVTSALPPPRGRGHHSQTGRPKYSMPPYICDQNWAKFPSLVFEIWYSQGFRVIAYCDLDL